MCTPREATSSGSIPGIRYVDFLMAGIFVQTVTFGSINTGIGLATDLQTGLMERFRSLPMARSAVLAGRALADVVRNLFVITLMVVVGFLVGFRVHTGVIPFLGAIALLLLFGLAMSWVMALIGLRTGQRRGRTGCVLPAHGAAGLRLQRLRLDRHHARTLRAYAGHQPVTATVDAVPGARHRRPHRGQGAGRHRLVGGHHGGVRRPGCPQLSPVG